MAAQILRHSAWAPPPPLLLLPELQAPKKAQQPLPQPPPQQGAAISSSSSRATRKAEAAEEEKEGRRLRAAVCRAQDRIARAAAEAATHEGAAAASQPVQLLPHVFLGNAAHAMDRAMLGRLGVEAVVNCALSCTLTRKAFYPEHWDYLELDAIDTPDYPLLENHFAEFSRFVDHCAQRGRKVLVHCHAGVNRSAALCVAYCMINKRLTMSEAIEYGVRLAPYMLQNEGFLQQLARLAHKHNLL